MLTTQEEARLWSSAAVNCRIGAINLGGGCVVVSGCGNQWGGKCVSAGAVCRPAFMVPPPAVSPTTDGQDVVNVLCRSGAVDSDRIWRALHGRAADGSVEPLPVLVDGSVTLVADAARIVAMVDSGGDIEDAVETAEIIAAMRLSHSQGTAPAGVVCCPVWCKTATLFTPFPYCTVSARSDRNSKRLKYLRPGCGASG